jgi:DNA-binding CsgD family transcriptional regulator
MPENPITQQALTDTEEDGNKVLCAFNFDNHDCLVIELTDEADIPVYVCDCHTIVEICRFEVNNRRCAIVTKVTEQTKLDLPRVLTTRELQIATLVALGCPNKQVADKLHISEWTVATYLRRVFAKLGVDTRAAMTYRCAALICKQDTMLSK